MEIKSQLKILNDGTNINNCKTCGWKLGSNTKCINCNNFNDPNYESNKENARIVKLYYADGTCRKCKFIRDSSICVRCLVCKGCGMQYKYLWKYCVNC